MQHTINIFIVSPNKPDLIYTFYKYAQKLRYNGHSILLHDSTPAIEIIKRTTADFRFRILVHLEYSGGKITNAAGWNEMNAMKEAFPNGEFVFITRDVELFQHGEDVLRSVDHQGFKIYNANNMTMDFFFEDVPVNVTCNIIVPVEPVAKAEEDGLGTVPQAQMKGEKQKEKVDVAVLCVISAEFDALDKVFDFKKSKHYRKINGLRVWKKTLEQKSDDGKKISALFAMIGIAGNLPSYLETNSLLQEFDIGLIVLCGIAMGSKDGGTPIYSVAVSDMVIYYENQRLEPNQHKEYRLNPIPIAPLITKDLPYIKEQLNELKSELKERIKPLKLKKEEFEGREWINKDWLKNIKIASGNILAGEKLFADGESFDGVAEVAKIGKSSVAGEMEGYGFGYACTQNEHKRWLIFRGISDHGGKEKSDPVNKKYQVIAALSAAILVKQYLLNIYDT